MTKQIEITNGTNTHTLTWDAQREAFIGPVLSDDEAMLDIELALCDKRTRGSSGVWSWRIIASTQPVEARDYRWIGLGII